MKPALAIFIVLAATTAPAWSAPPCTHEVLNVEGRPVSVDYCVSAAPHGNGGAEIVVPVTATYASSGGTLRRAVELHFLAGEGVSRVIESLDLTKVGLAGTLHLTLAYSHGMVRVDGALLTPGALTIK
jgi:hypothetical protein